VLLVVAPAMRRGTFTVGDLVLFTAYIEALSGLPRRIGRLLAFKRHADVAVDRLAPIVTHDPAGIAVHAPVYLKDVPPPLMATPPVDDPLHHIDIAGLSARHPASDRGIEGIDLRIERGDVVVIAGEVGAGKTTLVRALLGLIPIHEGTIRWNGQTIDDPSAFLVPPRAAYLPQVPVLFSESLDDNIRLGAPLAAGELDEALWLAVIEHDVAAMDDGLDTVVGPRGVRLSGGQQQRAAAARAFVRSSELLVVDDPSSALDVVTEEHMWNRLFDRRAATYLVVSNRREVLARADHAVVLANGRVAVHGRPEEVIEHPLLLRVWATSQGAGGRPRVER
jgi:ATP-binding cassette subfamily B protein